MSKEALVADLGAVWRINQNVNAFLIDHLSDEAWSAKPPGGKGRTIAAIFAHMHNVRLMWIKTAGRGAALPAKADAAADFSREQARAALSESAQAVTRILEQGFATGKVSGFPPSAAAFLGYLLAHDAHHRGQITMLARQTGHPVPPAAGFGLWEWNTRFKDES